VWPLLDALDEHALAKIATARAAAREVAWAQRAETTGAAFDHSFGYHPMLACCDNTGELLAAQLRPGNAGSNTAADHITVLDAALAQLPDRYRHGHPILVRADGARCTKAFLAHVRSLREQAVACEFSVGWTITGREHTAIVLLAERAWNASAATPAAAASPAGRSRSTRRG
jgi:hypothetical protein